MGEITDLAVSHDNSLIASSSTDRCIWCWELSPVQPRACLIGTDCMSLVHTCLQLTVHELGAYEAVFSRVLGAGHEDQISSVVFLPYQGAPWGSSMHLVISVHAAH